MSTSTTLHDLKSLILSFHPVLVIESLEEERVVALLQTAARELGMPLFEWSVTRGLTRDQSTGNYHGTTAPLAMLQHIEGLTIEAIYLLKDFARCLEDPPVARQLREVATRFAGRPTAIVISGDSVNLPREIDVVAVHHALALPDRDELRDVVKSVLDSLRGRSKFVVELNEEELDRLLGALSGMTLQQARQVVAQVVLEDGKLAASDLSAVLERKADRLRDGGLLEYFPAEDNHYEIGGFARLKTWLERARTGFSREARDLGLPAPKGILLVGVQGCGKSLAAKAIAREWAMPLVKLDMGRLYDKYVGESEKNFRRAISMAESMAPAVLWLDEIEKVLATGSAGGGGHEDGGLSRRLFAGFLGWLQEKKSEVFVVATANDVFSLPPELIRKGRFDEIFFVDLPDATERRTIFEIHLRLRKQDPATLDLEPLVTATEGFSGAELEQAVISALYHALHRKQPLDLALLLEEVKQTVPLSVSRREDVERLRSLASQRFVAVR